MRLSQKNPSIEKAGFRSPDPVRMSGLSRAVEVADTLPADAADGPPNFAEQVAAEEPLPFVMAEMALWGAVVSVLTIPIGLVGMFIAPLYPFGRIFETAAETLAAKSNPISGAEGLPAHSVAG